MLISFVDQTIVRASNKAPRRKLCKSFFSYYFFGIFAYFFCLCRPSETNLQLSCQPCWLPNKECHVPAGWKDAGFEPGTAGFTAWCTTIEPPHPHTLQEFIPCRYRNKLYFSIYICTMFRYGESIVLFYPAKKYFLLPSS